MWFTRTQWIAIAISLVANIGFWLLVWITYPTEIEAVILHYSVGVGIDFIGEGKRLFILPAVALSVLVLNTGLARFIQPAAQGRGAWILISVIPCVQLAAIVAYIIVWKVNT